MKSVVSQNKIENARYLDRPIAPLAIEPITLEGQSVRLEPLTMAHHAALWEIAQEEALWRWTPNIVRTPADLQAYMELALKLQTEGHALPFVTIYQPENRVVGSTRFLNIEKGHRRVEIGATFVGQKWQRTVVNSEAKYLMLRHAFEVWGCLRVELKTDALNTKSQNAMLRIGAKHEGTFRQHVICWDGRVRDTMYFSIIDGEWPSVKAKLEAKMINRE